MRTIFVLMLSLAAAAGPSAAPAHAEDRACWFDALSVAQKRDLVLGYAGVKQARGKPAADRWAQQQKADYEKQFEEAGLCPAKGPAAGAPSGAAGSADAKRGDGSCRHMELENQNIPNPGGSMGYALLWTCKD